MASSVLTDPRERHDVAGPTVVLRATSRRKVWLVLACWAGIWALLAGQGGAYSWHYFALGAHLLTHPGVAGGGLHLYAAHPELQIGPLALALAVPISAWGGGPLAQVLLTATGLLLLKVVADVRVRLTARTTPPLLLLTGGLLMLPIWSQVAAHFTHLDDALALAFCVAAIAGIAARRPHLTALALAAAIDSKPWALGFAALIIVLPREQRLRAALLTAAGTAFAWLPFVLTDPRTLQLGRFTIDNVDSSALRALGAHTATTPSWDRPAQVVLGLVVAAVCVHRGRWHAVPLAVIASRLLLDPETYPYYSSGLLIATVVTDLLRPQRRLPLWTAAAAAWFLLDRYGSVVLSPTDLGMLRAAYCIAVLAVLLGAPSDYASCPHRPDGRLGAARAEQPRPRVLRAADRDARGSS
ncbi:MAG TPA: hypothetical protein VGN48_05655 [Pedococcus sp.]|nr:hypothetical protein [Pedococcus sp.]